MQEEELKTISPGPPEAGAGEEEHGVESANNNNKPTKSRAGEPKT
jgi:hypothetical protein